MNELQGKKAQELLHALPVGKENAETADSLSRKIGTTQERTQLPIRELARILNSVGNPVASCSKGFFLAKDRDELMEYDRSLASRIEALEERRRLVQQSSLYFNAGKRRDQ